MNWTHFQQGGCHFSFTPDMSSFGVFYTEGFVWRRRGEKPPTLSSNFYWRELKSRTRKSPLMKDHSELSDRISFLEAKVRRSESAQDVLENTIEDLHEIIQDLKMKTFVENSEALPPFDGIPAKTESNKVILVEEQSQKVESADYSVQRRILSGGGSTGKEEIMDNSFNLCIIYSHGFFGGSHFSFPACIFLRGFCIKFTIRNFFVILWHLSVF